jgi:hypothetical protein
MDVSVDRPAHTIPSEYDLLTIVRHKLYYCLIEIQVD